MLAMKVQKSSKNRMPDPKQALKAEVEVEVEVEVAGVVTSRRRMRGCCSSCLNCFRSMTNQK